MAGKSKSWTPERRAAQAERMRQTKPWLQTTGPKTEAGKQAVKNNAYKHGLRSEDYKKICALLRLQKAFVQEKLAETIDFERDKY